MIEWFKWWFFEARKCEHDEGRWQMINAGSGKKRNCSKCGKCLQIIQAYGRLVMVKKINGCTLKIWRAKTLAGWSDLHYSCFRDADKLEVCSGTGALLGTDRFWSVYAHIKARIDDLMCSV